MTKGSFVGMDTLADAVDEAELPARVAVAELGAPANPDAVIVTTVPGGTLVAVTWIVTGFVVLAGNVISGVVKEPIGEAGGTTPATEGMLSAGGFVSTATTG